MSIKQNVFPSRFGFHPCDQETFLKLKRLKKLFWQAVYAHTAWERWARKRPKNRFYWAKKERAGKKVRSDQPIPEPLTCSVWTRENSYDWQNSRKPLIPLDDCGILEAFENARMPKGKSDQVVPLNLSIKEINKMSAESEKWSKER
jgi:hypothetical protein